MAGSNDGLRLQVASPCSVAWDSMTGDVQVRFCSICRKNVYDLTGLTRSEVEELIEEREGQVCVRFYVRHDGTVLTRDCSLGARVVRGASWARARVAGVVLGLTGFLVNTWGSKVAKAIAQEFRPRTVQILDANGEVQEIEVFPPGAFPSEPIMGKMMSRPPSAEQIRLRLEARKRKGRSTPHRD